MTKDQLLASLKPLEWSPNIFDTRLVCCRLMYSYTIYKDYNKYKIDYGVRGKYGYINDSFNTIQKAKAAAQEHYNNLVLELFNLELK